MKYLSEIEARSVLTEHLFLTTVEPCAQARAISAMIPKIRYLEWAVKNFPLVEWDLATSGIAQVTSEELGVPSNLSDASAFQRFAVEVGRRYGVPSSEVVPALGTSGALWVAAASLLGAGTEVLVEEPAYEPLFRVAEGFGAIVRRYPRVPAEGYRLDADRVVRLVTPRTRAVIVSNPHNPSGLAMPEDELRGFAEALRSRGVYLVVDEVYRELYAPATSARLLAPNIVALSSLTKCFGVGWARAGWGLFPPELVDSAIAATVHTTGELPWMTGAVAAHAFGQIDRLQARAQALGEGKWGQVAAFADRHKGALSWEPPARCMLFGFFEDRLGRDMRPLIEAGARHEKVLAVPGSFFGVPSGFRLSWALPAERLGEALRRLERALGLAST